MSVVINKENGESDVLLMLLCTRKNARTSSKRRRTCITTIVCFESLEI